MARRLQCLTIVLVLSGFALFALVSPAAYAVSVSRLQSATAGQEWADLPDTVMATYGLTYDQVAAISEGYPDGTWRPYVHVTRAQFTEMAVAAFGIDLADPEMPSFVDVPRSSVHYQSIEGAEAAGLLHSVTPSAFEPDAPITREQAVGLLSRCIALKNRINLATTYPAVEIHRILARFTDSTNISNTYRTEVAFAVDCHIITGDQLHNLAPVSLLTRIQAAALLMRSQPRTVVATTYCKGDGVTNDTAAIAAAFAACKVGDTLYFPAGTYYVATSITCKAGVNMTGDGDGRGAKISWIKGQVKTAPNARLTDLKMGRESTETYYCFGRTATHDMTVTRCTITGGSPNGNSCGVIAYAGVDCYNIQFLDCIIEGDPANYNRNGVALVNYGLADGRMYNVEFRNCTFKSQGRIGAEVIAYYDGAHSYDYPWTNVNFIGCTFEPMGAQGISTSITNLITGTVGSGSARFTNGYSTISDCTFMDCGTYAGTNAGMHTIELASTVHMNITNNHISGSHLHTMISQTTGWKWHDAGGKYYNYNVISGNVFDGSASSTSGMTLKGSGFTFSGNTVITRAHNYLAWNATDATITRNTFTALDASTGSGYSTTMSAAEVLDTNAVTLTGNTFSSRFCSTVYYGTDFAPPTGPSTNGVHSNNTFVKDAGDTAVYIQAGSSATETGSQYLLAN